METGILFCAGVSKQVAEALEIQLAFETEKYKITNENIPTAGSAEIG